MKCINEEYNTNKWGRLIVVKYVNCEEVYVKFLETGCETKTSMVQVRRGTVKDALKPSVCGVGIVGTLDVKVDGKILKEYSLWRGMLNRCYDSKFQDKNPSYKDCTVSENFKYFPFFKEWCNKQVGFGNEGWQLDKDILVKGNRIYSEDTCCFVPREVNGLFIKRGSKRGYSPLGVTYNKTNKCYQASCSKKGVKRFRSGYNTPEEAFYAYKEVKEAYIKEVANKWKDQIDLRVYNALMNYEVEIGD